MASNADKIVDALKAVVKSALCQGFTKTSFLVRDHIKYIKKIQSANDPELHVIYTAKKLFPNAEAYIEKINKINDKYKDDLLSSLERLYELYFEIRNEAPQRRKIAPEVADSILTDLLI